MTSAKEHNFPVTNPKQMEICDVSDKELKTIVLRNLSELQENTKKNNLTKSGKIAIGVDR